MKSLYEGILGDIETRVMADDAGDATKAEILQYLNDHYLARGRAKWNISKFPNKDGKYEVHCNSSVTATEAKHKLINITNGKFVFSEIKGWFDVCLCHSLESLEGCPTNVYGMFNCSNCTSLKSLKGCPKYVAGEFKCYGCGKDFKERDVLKLCQVGSWIRI